jgi:hypothetical protein
MARDLDMENSVHYTADLGVADQKRVQDPPRWKTKICVSSIPHYNLEPGHGPDIMPKAGTLIIKKDSFNGVLV